MKSISESEYEKIKILYTTENYTKVQLSQLYKCHTTTVTRVLKRMGVDTQRWCNKSKDYINPQEKISINDKPRIIDLYYNQHKTLKEIGKLYNCSECTMIRVFRKFNLKTRRPGQYFKHRDNPKEVIKKCEYEKIKKLYLEDYLSIASIGKMYNVRPQIIRRILKRMDIKIRKVGEVYNYKQNPTSLFNKNQAKEIIKLYIEKQMSSYEIADRYGCSPCVVINTIKRNNVKPRTSKEEFSNPKKLKKRLKRMYNRKDYLLPSGKIIKLQGYEPQFLDYIFNHQLLKETDVIYSPKHIEYFDKNNKKHIYFPDFYIPMLNLIIEIKSSYTQKLDKNIEYKKRGCFENGFNYMLVLDNKFDDFTAKINQQRT